MPGSEVNFRIVVGDYTTTVGNGLYSEQFTALLSAMWCCLRKHRATLATTGMLRCTNRMPLLNIVCSLKRVTGRLCEGHVEGFRLMSISLSTVEQTISRERNSSSLYCHAVYF